MWRHYFQNTQLVIYVVDGTRRDRLEENKIEISRILYEDEMRDVPLLVLVNKAELEDCIPLNEVIIGLDLKSIDDRKVHVAS